MQYQFHLPDGYLMRDLIHLNQVVVRRKWFLWLAVGILRIVLSVVGFMLLLTGVFMLFGNYDVQIVTAVVIGLVGLVWFLLGIFYYRYGAWRSRRLMLKDVGAITVTMTDDQIEEQTEKGASRFSYQMVQEVLLFRDTYFLFLDRRHALILPIRSLTEGHAHTFAAFWHEKAQQSLRTI